PSTSDRLRSTESCRPTAPVDEPVQDLSRTAKLIHWDELVCLVGHLDVARTEEHTLEAGMLEPSRIAGKHHTGGRGLARQLTEEPEYGRVGRQQHRRAFTDRLEGKG